MTGLELFKNPATTAGELADVVSQQCPPGAPVECDGVACRECWLAWIVTGEPPKGKEPSEEQTAPNDARLHPNLREHLRKQRRVEKELLKSLALPFAGC